MVGVKHFMGFFKRLQKVFKSVPGGLRWISGFSVTFQESQGNFRSVSNGIREISNLCGRGGGSCWRGIDRVLGSLKGVSGDQMRFTKALYRVSWGFRRIQVVFQKALLE